MLSWMSRPDCSSERWDAPCIVTTSVGFFQPLFSAKPADCRHLHQLANSVLVLDEAQSLPPYLLDATLRTVKLLCTQYGCTVVFSTATQPLWLPAGVKLAAQGNCAGSAALFAATRRVTVDWRLKQPISLWGIAGEVAQENQACAIVNLRAHARPLYRQLVEQTGAESTFFLTTDLCPAHRLAVLREIRENAGRTSLPPGVYPMHRGRCGSGFSSGIPGAGAVGCHHPGGGPVQPKWGQSHRTGNCLCPGGGKAVSQLCL